jgi:hypothetical protein
MAMTPHRRDFLGAAAVWAVEPNGLPARAAAATPAPAAYDVRQWGAAGDGRTLCTAAIQRALDEAGRSGGGTVVVPPGSYLTGTLHLRSRVTLELQNGATLLGSPRLEDYPQMPWSRQGDRHRHHLLVADGVDHVQIGGGGTIDGQGHAFWEPQGLPRQWIRARDPRVSPLIELRRCSDLRLLDVEIVRSPGWTVHLHRCDRVWVRGVKLVNHLFGPNTDGFDIDSCRDVLISDCYVECGDDAIVLKTGADGRPLERVTVNNCVLRTHCVGLKLGAGETYHDMRQIVFANCVVYGCTRAVGLYNLRGSVQEDIVVSNIVCDTDSGFLLNRPLHIDLRAVDGGRAGTIRNVLVSHLVARTDGRLLLTAADGGKLEHIVLRDVHLRYPVVDDPAATAPQAGSGQFSNHSPEARAARAAVVADGVRQLVIEGLTIGWPDGPPRGWSGPKNEDESARTYPGREGDRDPPFHVLWGRNLHGGMIRAPLARPNRAGVAPFDVQQSDIAIRE